MKKVLVTGSSGGLGFLLAEHLLEKNYFVVLHYFQHKEAVFSLHERYPETSICVQADFAKEEDLFKIKKVLEEKEISLDALVNNAGIDHVSDLEEKDKESFLKVFLVNTYAPFLLMKLFGKEIEEKKGHIVNISSDNTIDKMDVRTMEYDASKSALNILTKDYSLAYPDAHVNALLFGWLDTNMNQIPLDIKPFLEFVPLERAVLEIEEMLHTNETGKMKVVRK